MPHACHSRFWKCYKTLHVVLTFGKVQNALSLPRKTTSEPSKVVRACGALNILTWKCASRHNDVHFFDISTSISGPKFVCFAHVDFEMSSRHKDVHFFDISTSKSGLRPQFVTLLTSKFALRHNGVQFFISHLPRWLPTRRFSEPTFRPSGATNHWKNTVCRDFATFSRTCIFFPLALSLL